MWLFLVCCCCCCCCCRYGCCICFRNYEDRSGRAGLRLSDWYYIYRYYKTKIYLQQPSKQCRIFAAGQSLDVVRIVPFGVYVFVFLLCRCLLQDARKKDYCGLSVLLMPMLLAMYAYALGNMDVKSVATLIDFLLFHLRLRFPTFRPPLRLKFCRRRPRNAVTKMYIAQCITAWRFKNSDSRNL